MNHQRPQKTITELLKTAQLLQEKCNNSEALRVYNIILENKPNHIKTLFLRGLLHQKCNRLNNALEDFKALLNLPSTKHVVHVRIADTLKLMGCYDQAIDHYIKTTDLEPSYISAYIPLIYLLEQTGRIQEAKEVIQKALEITPNSGDLHGLNAYIYSLTDKSQQAEYEYKKAISLAMSDQIKPTVYSGLIKLLEKKKKYDEAISLNTKLQKFCHNADISLNNRPDIMDSFINQSYKWVSNIDSIQWDEYNLNEHHPAFLIGFPRSGTTLMEQLLFAQGDITVTDELGALPYGVNHIEQVLGRNISYPKDLYSLTLDEIAIWKKKYFENLKSFTGTQKSKLVDKNPMSLLYLPAIKRFFSKSPVIMMIRDPRDVCLSCFFQTFAPNASNAHFYSLENTAKYYANSMDLYRLKSHKGTRSATGIIGKLFNWLPMLSHNTRNCCFTNFIKPCHISS